MTAYGIKKLISAADAAFSRHLKEADADFATEACVECNKYRGKLEGLREVQGALKAERRKPGRPRKQNGK